MSQTSTSPIAVIEDDSDLRNDLVEYLQWQGFAATGFDSAEALYRRLSPIIATGGRSYNENRHTR